MSPEFTVIVPTYNRASYLPTLIEALASQVVDGSRFEILIVDNNSTDDTRAVVLDLAPAFPHLNIRYILERSQGAAIARNRAMLEATGRVFCFLDDDTIPSPEWLDSISMALADPSVGCVGGRALLDYQGQPRPPWLRGDMQGLLGGYELPYTKPTTITKVAEYPYSCNMAVRAEVISEVGLFRSDLDRVGNRKLAAGETELVRRIQKAGWKIIYLPGCQVRHLVAPERLQKEYIRRIGRGLAATHVYLTLDDRFYMTIRWFLSDLWYATRMLSNLAVAILRRKPLWFDDYMRFWMVALRLPIRLTAILRTDAVLDA